MKLNVRILCLAIALSTACGSDDDNNNTNNDGNNQNNTTNNANNTPQNNTSNNVNNDMDMGNEDVSDPEDECALTDAPTCFDETTMLVCTQGEPNLVLEQQSCADETECVFGMCVTSSQQQNIAQLEDYIAQVKNTSGIPHPVEWEALTEITVREYLSHDDSEDAVIRAVTRFARTLKHGHQGVLFGAEGEKCGEADGIPYTAQTFYAGVCGKPLGNEILVTGAPQDNVLGLNPGDVIVSTSSWTAGEDFLDQVAQAPGCLTRVGASEGSDRAEAAATFFGKIDEGMTLEVRTTDGSTRSVDVPARETTIDEGSDFCISTWGGYSFVEAELTLRPDGVAVIRSSTLRPAPWTDSESYYEEVQNFLDRVGAVLDQVPDGTPIVWDIRGNSGGSAEVAYGIVAGMPGAIAGETTSAYWRVDDTDPPEWQAEPEPFQSYVIPAPAEAVTNHADHDVAVLIDGQTLSAGDHLAWGAKHRANVLLVGPEGTSGSFGFGGAGWKLVDGPTLPFLHRVDPFKVENSDGEFMERSSVQPDMIVDYVPSDIASGIDTVLEAAVTALQL